MARFVLCSDVERRGAAVWINVDLVQSLRRVSALAESNFSSGRPECTQVWFTSNGAEEIGGCDYVYVTEEPATIVSRAREA